MRGVRCYDRKGLRSYSCSRYHRPEVEHGCDLSPCQQPTTSGERWLYAVDTVYNVCECLRVRVCKNEEREREREREREPRNL